VKVPTLADLRTGWLDWRRPRFWIWISLLAYTLAGFLLVPWIARAVIVDIVRDRLGLEARLADVDVNPFVLSARLHDFAIAGVERGELLAFDELRVDLQASSLFRRTWTFAEIRLLGLYVDIERRADGTLNLAALLPPSGPAPTEVDTGTEPGGPVRLIVDRLEVSARADFRDAAAHEPYATSFGPIDVVVVDLSTLPGRDGVQQITVVGEGGARLVWSGKLGLSPLRSSGEATLSGLPLQKLSAYLPASIAARIGSGTARIAFDYHLAAQPSGFAATIDALTAEVSALRVDTVADDATQPLLNLAALTVHGGRLRWPEREVAVDRISLTAPVVEFDRDATGRFTWHRLVDVPSDATAEPHAAQESTASEGPPWSVSLARFEITDGKVGFSDATLDPAATFSVDSIAIAADDLALAEDTLIPFTARLAVTGGGQFSLGGTLRLRPELLVESSIDVEGLALVTAQPYLAARTLLALESGAVDARGHVVADGDGGVAFKGSASIVDVALVLADSRTPIVRWRRLDLNGIDVDVATRRFALATAELDGAFARARIDESGAIDVGHLLRTGEDDEGDAVIAAVATDAHATPEAPWTFGMARFDFADGGADYRDDSLPIPFAARITSLDGRISALDTTSARPADVRLEGKVGDFGVLRLEGALQPLDIARNTLFTARFENIDLRDATPYAIHFAGRRIATGKLDLDTRYRVEERKLTASHDIVLRDFVLGERVESPDAINLPLDLAVSLLKDSDGTIHVELPIEGDVDDPKFRVGGIIRQAIVNLIVKIVTSPFRLLGMLVGLGGDSDALDEVSFQPGRADLAPPEQEKIQKLAQALTLRPQIRLDVPAPSAEATDGAALRRARVQARIDRAAGDNEPDALRRAVESVAEVAVTPEERAALEARFTAQETTIATADLDELAYLGALTDLVVEREPIGAADLEALARARQDAVIDAIRAEPNVAPERVSAGAAVDVEPTGGAIRLVFAIDTLAAESGSDSAEGSDT
jgi:hypothetical protein